MLKVIVSSKELAKKLQEIDFSREQVIMAELRQNGVGSGAELYLYGSLGSIADMFVESRDVSQCWPQDSVRWDWVKNTTSKVEEQPVTLTIKDNQVEVKFYY